MPAHTINLSDPQAVLRILLALILEEGGELRFMALTYDRMERGRLITIDYDQDTAEVVLRASTDMGAVVKVEPEAHAWSKPVEVAPLERARAAAAMEAEHHYIPSDEQMAEREEELQRKAQVAKDIADGKSPLRIKVR